MRIIFDPPLPRFERAVSVGHAPDTSRFRTPRRQSCDDAMRARRGRGAFCNAGRAMHRREDPAFQSHIDQITQQEPPQGIISTWPIEKEPFHG